MVKVGSRNFVALWKRSFMNLIVPLDGLKPEPGVFICMQSLVELLNLHYGKMYIFKNKLLPIRLLCFEVHILLAIQISSTNDLRALIMIDFLKMCVSSEHLTGIFQLHISCLRRRH